MRRRAGAFHDADASSKAPRHRRRHGTFHGFLLCRGRKILSKKPKPARILRAVSKRPKSPRKFAADRPEVIPGLGPDVAELRQARALWMANRFDESLHLFELAVQRYPQNL